MLLLWLFAGAADAGEPAAGMALFNNIPDSVLSCGNQSCHGPNPNDNVNGLQKGANNAGVIQTAIRSKVPQMMFLNGLLNPFQLDDLAAYLAPQPSLSGEALDFGGRNVGTGGPAQTATLTDIGGTNLSLAGVTLAGANPGDFAVGGTCAGGATLASTTILQSGGTCTVTVAFVPGATGPRSASVTLVYAGPSTFPSSHTIALSGEGTLALAPAAVISPVYIDFGEIAVGAASAAREFVIANIGNAALHVAGLALTGSGAGEFHLQGWCASSSSAAAFVVAAGASCTIEIVFIPARTDLRHAELVVTHDAADSPARVALTGVGAATACAPPQPPRELQTLTCAAGEAGAITQARDALCQGTSWEFGPWTTVADTCSRFGAADLELVEYHNTNLDHYFITADPAERQSVETGGAGPGWVRTATLGRAWSTASDAGLAPVCRFYGNRAPGSDGRPLGPNSHFYTIDPAECAAVKNDHGWIYEGIVFAAVAPVVRQCPAPLIPVYRNYNSRFAANDSNHRYTSDPAIARQMTALGWAPEGVVVCLLAF